jgi:methionine-rich copper-binding protein CopC
MKMRLALSGVFAAILLLGMPASARAHAFLDHAVPAVGSTVASAPRELRLFFSEAVEPLFSTIELADASGHPVATGKATADTKNRAQLVLTVPPLVPGRYRVTWHVVSVDTHRTEGDFTFEIKP